MIIPITLDNSPFTLLTTVWRGIVKNAIKFSFIIPCLKKEIVKSSLKVQGQITSTTVAGAKI